VSESGDKTLEIAVALRYDGQGAPFVAAKGKGQIAEQIIAKAKEHDIPLREEPELVKLLSKVPLGDEIPRELYVAVAEVIAFAYSLRGEQPHDNRQGGGGATTAAGTPSPG
jgi:flagellar biosynthesis protein